MENILTALKHSSEISSSLAIKLDQCEKTINQLNNKISKLENELVTLKESSINTKSIEYPLTKTVSNKPKQIEPKKIIKKKILETSESLKDFIKDIKRDTASYNNESESETETKNNNETENYSMLMEVTEIPNKVIQNSQNMNKDIKNIKTFKRTINRKFR